MINKMKYGYIVSSIDQERTKAFSDKVNTKANIIHALDVRTALYYATGIAAQKNEPVIVLSDSNNSSRSAFSGMTEAFYRQLPVMFITIGTTLNYSEKINDTVNSHYIISNATELLNLSDISYPAHIEMKDEEVSQKLAECARVQEYLRKHLEDDDYLYIGQGIKKEEISYRCKIVYGGINGCLDGAVANVLGASLAKKRKRYMALITDVELIHDINTLGNINMNNSVRLVVICDEYNAVISETAKSLGYSVNMISENTLEEREYSDIFGTLEKSITLIYKD